jgi:hypothetical protein
VTHAATIPIAAPGRGTAWCVQGTRAQLIILLAAALLLGLLLAFSETLVDLPLRELCGYAAAYSMVVMSLTFLVSPRGIFSAPMTYVAVLWVFHFGLVLSYAVEPDAVLTGGFYIREWFFRHGTRVAVVMACIGLTACVLGIYAATPMRSRASAADTPDPGESGDAASPQYLANLSIVGFVLIVLGLGAWLAMILLAGGPGLLFSDYVTFLAVTADSPLIWAYLVLGAGMTLAAMAPPTPWRHAGYALFALWAVVAFPLGLRGEVLFPLCTSLMISARRRAPLSTAQVLLAALLLLVAIAVVRDLRQVGVTHASKSLLSSANPLGALSEMGSSLRPVSEVVTWKERGEDYMWGATYWAPFDRALGAILLDPQRLPADRDPRIMNIVISERVAFIGFSVVAEAHRNFGVVGVAAVMFLIGLLLGRVERWPPGSFRTAVLGIIFVQLMFHVRNDFIAVPAQTAFGIILVYVATSVARYRARGAAEPLPAAAPLQVAGAEAQQGLAQPRAGWGRRRHG